MASLFPPDKAGRFHANLQPWFNNVQRLKIYEKEKNYLTSVYTTCYYLNLKDAPYVGIANI
jgi:hypothetical protein